MTRPNVLFIACDDLASITHLLHRLMPTLDYPNIARITGQGNNFARSYCTVPICGPSRASIMTGMSPVESGVLANAPRWEWIMRPENLLTYRFRQAGYYVGTVGKIHHGYVPLSEPVHRALYDNPIVHLGSWQPERAKHRRDGIGPITYPAGTEDQFYDGKVRAATIEFLQTYDGSRPFWWECGFKAPHTPYEATEDYDIATQNHPVILPADWEQGWTHSDFATKWMGKAFADTPPSGWSLEERTTWQASVRNYAASVLMLDDNIGKVLDALEASPHAQNTIVSFVSDHGYHLGDMGRWHKFTLWEQAALAPLAIRLPNAQGGRIDTPVSHHDLMATLMDYCDVPVPMGYRGISLRPLMETGTSAAHESRMVPTFWFGCASGISGRWRVTMTYDGTGEMFDVVDDPFCRRNLAGTHPDWPDLQARLIRMMADWGWSVVTPASTTQTIGSGVTTWGPATTALQHPPRTIATWGPVAIDGRTPNYHEVYYNLTDSPCDYPLPAQVQGVRFSGEFVETTATIFGNSAGNDIDLATTAAAMIHVHMGEGTDSFWDDAGNPVEIWAGPGEKTIERFGNRGGTFHGGVGHAKINGGAGDDTVHGGFGTMLVLGNGGDNSLFTGHSDVTTWLHAGRNTIVIEGGRNQINPGQGPDRITIYRTGLPQDLRGLDDEDRIDLSDFAPLGPGTWSSQNDTTHTLHIAEEEIIFRGLSLKTLKTIIIGYES